MNCEQLCWMGGICSSNFHSLPSSASVVRALSQCTIFKSSLSILLSLGIHFFCILLLLVIITTRSKSGSMHAVAAEEVVTECALWKIFESSKTCKISLCNELVRRSTIYQSCKLRDPLEMMLLIYLRYWKKEWKVLPCLFFFVWEKEFSVTDVEMQINFFRRKLVDTMRCECCRKFTRTIWMEKWRDLHEESSWQRTLTTWATVSVRFVAPTWLSALFLGLLYARLHSAAAAADESLIQ